MSDKIDLNAVLQERDRLLAENARLTKRNAILRQNLHEVSVFLVNQTSFVHNRIDAINAALDGEETK